jgi:hypothetical protein
MQAAGVLPHTVAAVLNHSTAGLFGVTAIYLRDRQEEAKRAAMDIGTAARSPPLRTGPASRGVEDAERHEVLYPCSPTPNNWVVHAAI